MIPTRVKFRGVAPAVAFGLALAGCSQAPVPASTPAVFNMQSALIGVSNWQGLAKDTAQDIIACLEGRVVWRRQDWPWTQGPACLGDMAGLKGKPLHVELADSGSPFGRAFHDLLTTELVVRGWPVSRSAEGATVVRYRVQTVERDGDVGLHSFPGPLTVLGYGPFALGGTARIVSWGALADLYGSAAAFGGAEVVITTSLIDGERLVMRRSDGYYVAAADVGRYRTFGPVADLAPPRHVSGSPAVRGFEVVGK